MKCPHCAVAFSDVDAWKPLHMPAPVRRNWAWYCQVAECPECDSLVIKGQRAGRPLDGVFDRSGFYKEQILYPVTAMSGPISTHVPDLLRLDYLEACAVLHLSPKASAALSRRVLESVLRKQGYHQKFLGQQIKAVLDEKDVDKVLPSNLKDLVRVVQRFGNFAAHPIEDGEAEQPIDAPPQLIEVEEGEASWCLTIIERLFDHYFVQPAYDAERLAAFDQKSQRAI